MEAGSNSHRFSERSTVSSFHVQERGTNSIDTLSTFNSSTHSKIHILVTTATTAMKQLYDNQPSLLYSPYTVLRPSVVINLSTSLKSQVDNHDELSFRSTYVEEFGTVPMLPIAERALLTFKDVAYTRTSAFGPPLRLLTGVRGAVKPGELCAIMGSSGAGANVVVFL